MIWQEPTTSINRILSEKFFQGWARTKIPEKDGFGIDVVTGNMVNMINNGIIDPLLVTKSALLNAASVASTILSTDCIINNIRLHEGDRK